MLQPMIELNPNRPIRLDNCVCVYCADQLHPRAMTKEHVVGRNFVPKGTLNGNWNLIANACSHCNNLKADLENDISAITMLPHVTRKHFHADLRIAEIADRKASGAFSRHTGRTVRESREELNLKGDIGPNVSISFGLIGHPHIDDDRAFLLAQMHLTSFFFFITYDRGARRGYYWPGGFRPLMIVRQEDWGNERIRAFAERVKSWPPRLYATTAQGFFKVTIRRHPSAECWSWAIEWNQSTRLIGFFGCQEAADAIIAGLPQLQMEVVARRADGMTVRMRAEQALDPNNDNLFARD